MFKLSQVSHGNVHNIVKKFDTVVDWDIKTVSEEYVENVKMDER